MELKRKKNYNIHTKLVGCLTKNGKKTKSKINIVNSFQAVCKSSDLISGEIVQHFADVLGTIVELRTVRMRKNVFTVPVPVNASRRNYLIVRKIVKTVFENKAHIKLEQKLIQEFINILKNKNSKAILERKKVVEEAVKNKGNLHFRW